jgi:hypothetical protein
MTHHCLNSERLLLCDPFRSLPLEHFCRCIGLCHRIARSIGWVARIRTQQPYTNILEMLGYFCANLLQTNLQIYLKVKFYLALSRSLLVIPQILSEKALPTRFYQNLSGQCFQKSYYLHTLESFELKVE